MFSEDQVSDIVQKNIIRKFVAINREVDSKASFDKVLDKAISELSKVAYIEGFDGDVARELSAKYKGRIETAARVVFKPSHMAGKKKIQEYCGLLLAKRRALPSYSGIVIAGFGDNEPLPHLREYTVDILVDRRIRYWLSEKYDINRENQSEVVPLADDEVTKTLIEGISPGFKFVAYQGALKLILGMPKKILDQVKELNDSQRQKYINAARSALPQHFSDFTDGINDYRQKTYTDPIKQALSSLPVSELGIIAETFLGASQIQKRVSPDLETIGGPVDVAVISKGDGSVWIKRKHYFDGNVNPMFLEKYFEQ